MPKSAPTWQPPEKTVSKRRANIYLPPVLAERMTLAERHLGTSGTRPNWSLICQRAITAFLEGIGF